MDSLSYYLRISLFLLASSSLSSSLSTMTRKLDTATSLPFSLHCLTSSSSSYRWIFLPVSPSFSSSDSSCLLLLPRPYASSRVVGSPDGRWAVRRTVCGSSNLPCSREKIPREHLTADPCSRRSTLILPSRLAFGFGLVSPHTYIHRLTYVHHAKRYVHDPYRPQACASCPYERYMHACMQAPKERSGV